MDNLETFICSTALPVLDSGSHYPGWFDTVSETYLHPIGKVWMKGMFSGFKTRKGFERIKELHGGCELIVKI